MDVMKKSVAYNTRGLSAETDCPAALRQQDLEPRLVLEGHRSVALGGATRLLFAGFRRQTKRDFDQNSKSPKIFMLRTSRQPQAAACRRASAAAPRRRVLRPAREWWTSGEFRSPQDEWQAATRHVTHGRPVRTNAQATRTPRSAPAHRTLHRRVRRLHHPSLAHSSCSPATS